MAFPFFKSEFLVYSLIVVFAAGGAMVTPNLLSAVSLLSRTNTGRNISIQSSTNSVGQILGPVLGTWLVTGGFYYPFIVAGIIVLIAISFLFFLKNPYRHKK
ncbi:MFS transporter [Leeuwenhoekiella nanhaiensis]|uniref:MFS transporter n=1 Tax=Leeuwenhoekiella nanhaiensis TaxID=1655491 RepID=UPI0021CD8064|nr:MFS transporter [Leeuwenhoekiella nanhaiensis]